MKIPLIPALLLTITSSATSLPKALATAAERYDYAQMHGDRKAFEESLAPDYVLVNSSGKVESRSEFINESCDPTFHLNPYKVEEPIERVWANGAVLAGVTTVSGTDHGKPFSARLRFADVWAFRNGKWQVVMTEVTRAAQK